MLRIHGVSNLLKRLATTSAFKDTGHTFAKNKLSHLPNGLTVCTTECGGAVAQAVLAYRAGSRYEESDELGLAHCLRNSVGTDSDRAFGVYLLQQCNNKGVELRSHLTRDMFAVQASMVRESASDIVPFVCELSQPAIKPWSLENVRDAMEKDVQHKKPHEILLDCLHRAAFRNGPLGNPLFADEGTVNQVNYCKLRTFIKSRLVSGQAIFVGVNMEHQNLLQSLENCMKITEKAGKQEVRSKYFGGEARHQMNLRKAYVAIAGEGVSLKDPKGLATQSVLLSLISCRNPLKYGPNRCGTIAEAIFKASSLYPFEMATIDEAYWDTGLVGICINADAHMITPLVHAALTSIKTATVDDRKLADAKATAAVEWLIKSENSYDTALGYATQLLGSGEVTSPMEFVELIKGVTKDDVAKALERMKKKLTMASVGNISHVPYLDEMA